MAYFVQIPKDSCTFEAILFLILQLEVFLQTEKGFHLKTQTSWQKRITLKKIRLQDSLRLKSPSLELQLFVHD